ncbi:OS9 endoplasmic reticulum lectin [Phyllostomus discolor]|uniref:Endoplasmic reticulum lectin n=1 Tax=Phyllostomus discolor TaxID=89673 RepID=A0A834AZZ4_9CHIR|nr:OS9 endoplasmic reticulum lectin [Phyllostomus discolor]
MAAEQLLSSLLGLLFLGLLLPAALTGGVGSLNLEELSEMRYGIEILPLPVMGGQSQASDVVIVSSKYKQRYECRLPAGAIHFQREREEETPAYQGPGIPELLSPMKDAPCLLKTKDWWTYEFCYGRHIQQYHMEDSEIKGEVLYLGYYQSAFDWDDETAKASKQHRLKRYHSQTYGNGSKCDLNGRPREAEVRFLCDEGAGISGDYIDRVDEPLSCSYVLTVRTPRLCPHPLLRPPPSAAPQAILCHPALQPEEYLAYLQRQADSKQYEDKMIEELHDLDPPVWSETAPGVAPTKRAAASPAKDDSKEPDFWKMMIHEPEDQVQGREEAQAEEQEPNLEPADPAPGSPDDFQSNVQVKVIRSPADLIRLIEELKGGTKKGKPNAGQEQPTDGAAEAPPSEPEVKAKLGSRMSCGLLGPQPGVWRGCGVALLLRAAWKTTQGLSCPLTCSLLPPSLEIFRAEQSKGARRVCCVAGPGRQAPAPAAVGSHLPPALGLARDFLLPSLATLFPTVCF